MKRIKNKSMKISDQNNIINSHENIESNIKEYHMELIVKRKKFKMCSLP